MLDFVLKNDRKKIKRNYLCRISIVIMMFLSIAFIFGIVILIPSYFTLSSQEQNLNKQIEDLKETEIFAKYDQLVNTRERVMHHYEILNINNSHHSLRYSNYISIISERINPGISVNNIKIEVLDSKKSPNILVSGQAERREQLVSFVNSLRGSNMFREVDLPISDLAKESDLNFNLTIKTRLYE